jgi:hypothetical protein
MEDLVDLYRRTFSRILSRVDAKASPYSKYYIAVSTPQTWNDIMATSGDVLARLGRLEDGTPQSVPVSVIPLPCVHEKPPPLCRTLKKSARVHPMLMMCLFFSQGIAVPWRASESAWQTR